MAERLKQIWAGFAETTERNLTGKGVEDIIVPERHEYAALDDAWLPEGFEAPYSRAVGVLQAELASKAKRRGRKSKTDASTYAGDEDIEAVDTSYAEDALVAGLRATAIRTERSFADYEAFLDTAEGKAVLKKTKKKKRFGLF